MFCAWIGWRKQRTQPWVGWLTAWSVGAWVMSLGPFLQVAGKMTYIPLPGFLVTIVPLLQNARSPGRWTVFVTLGVALLAAGGIKYIQDRYGYKKAIAVTIAVLVISLFEFLPMPYPVSTAIIPDIFYNLPATPGHPAVLDVPVGRQDGLRSIGQFHTRSLLYQTAHMRPIIGGYVSRTKPDDFALLENGLLSNTIQAQDSTVHVVRPPSRGEGLKNRIREWAKEGHPVTKPLRFLIGETKWRDILERPTQVKAVPQPVTSEQAVEEADKLGLGLVVAVDPEKPSTTAALGYLRAHLPLRTVHRTDECEVLVIEYPDTVGTVE